MAWGRVGSRKSNTQGIPLFRPREGFGVGGGLVGVVEVVWKIDLTGHGD